MNTQPSGPGNDALDDILAAHIGRPGHLWLSADPQLRSATDGLFYGTRVYRLALPVTHWLNVTFGLSKRGGKVSEEESESGCGYELTLRIPWQKKRSGFFSRAKPKPAESPEWGYTLLATLVDYHYSKGARFSAGDYWASATVLRIPR